MPVPVVDVRVVRMLMCDRSVPVAMHMRLSDAFVRRVQMLVMFVVAMRVLVRERLVRVRVVVPLREVQPYAASHETGS